MCTLVISINYIIIILKLRLAVRSKTITWKYFVSFCFYFSPSNIPKRPPNPNSNRCISHLNSAIKFAFIQFHFCTATATYRCFSISLGLFQFSIPVTVKVKKHKNYKTTCSYSNMGNANLKKIVLDSYKRNINQYQLNENLDSNWTTDNAKTYSKSPFSARHNRNPRSIS